jgi:hypothetical protein
MFGCGGHLGRRSEMLETNLELNFDEILIGWFSSKNVSGGTALRPKLTPQPKLV